MTRNIQRALFFCVMFRLQHDWNSAIHKAIMPGLAAGLATGLAAGLTTNSVAGLTAVSPGLKKSRMSPCAPGPSFVPKHEVVQASCAVVASAAAIAATFSVQGEPAIWVVCVTIGSLSLGGGAGVGSRSCRGCDGIGRSCRGSDGIGSSFCIGCGIGRRTCRACSDIGVGGGYLVTKTFLVHVPPAPCPPS